MVEKKRFQRLSKDVVPSHYVVRLQPDLKAFTFSGQVVIHVQVVKPTQVISLNSVEIDIQTATYSFPVSNAKDHLNAKLDYKSEDGIVTLNFEKTLDVGDGVLTLNYTGILNNKMKGFYRSKYFGPDGEERYAAVTQFEATDARRALPCWDEPAVKSTFDVTLIVPKDKVALSNMHVIEDKIDESNPDLKIVRFAKTPVMSTYLLAFVVGEYDYLEDKTSNGHIVRVYTPVGKKEQGQFALKIAVQTIPFYENYFKVPYPLSKIDLIAVADFAAGAMENWGLVVYRENALLIDAHNSSSSARQWVAIVVAHELAHQWFGNLVTMEWWTHLWLKEGFASWIENLSVDYCLPEMDIWTQFVSSAMSRALTLDALKNSHPIEVPVGHPAEVDEIFDDISYYKGASVIRMLHDYIGDEDFRKGMHLYLTSFEHKNTSTEDLWASLEQACGKPVTKVMRTWTEQMGFPVLKVKMRQEKSKRILEISQEKFHADGSSGNDSLWQVPISICSSSNPNSVVKQSLLTTKSVTVVLEDIKPDEWIKINHNCVGFYRTQYESDDLNQFLPSIKERTLSPTDRLGLEDDLFALVKSGAIPTTDFLKVLDAYINEQNYTVWIDIASNLSSLGRILKYMDYYDSFKAFGRDLFSKIVHQVGWDAKEGEGHLDSMLRGLVLTTIGHYGDKGTIEEAQKRFAKHIDGSCPLPADIRVPVYHMVLANGDANDFETLLKLYNKADLQEEKVRILRALGCVKTEDLVQRVLDFAMSKDVRAQDRITVFSSVSASPLGRDMAWKVLQENWEELYGFYEGGFLLSDFVKSTTEGFVTNEKAQEIEAFFKAHPSPSTERAVQQSCENVCLNARWLARDSKLIKDWLQSRE